MRILSLLSAFVLGIAFSAIDKDEAPSESAISTEVLSAEFLQDLFGDSTSVKEVGIRVAKVGTQDF